MSTKNNAVRRRLAKAAAKAERFGATAEQRTHREMRKLVMLTLARKGRGKR